MTGLLAGFCEHLRCRVASQAGFTLVEIMVALAILALSGIALLSNVNQATSDLARLNDKVIALSVAEYAINQILIKDEFPETGSDSENVTLSDRDWLVEITISETPNESVRRIDALVRPEGESLQQQQAATILLSAFKADL